MQVDDKSLEETLRIICIIGEQRRQHKESLRQALVENDQEKIIYFAKILYGVENESDRIPPSINSRTGG